jgi:ATPase subunit of ABC transporter with duplicated ATPase domains
MSIDLKRVRVKGLFDTFDLDVPIEDNTLILVGENGSGKSTLINLIYYALTAQWDRIIELPFQICTITIGEKDYQLEKGQLPISQKRSGILSYFERRMSRNDLNALLEALAENSPEYWFTTQGREELRDLNRTFSFSFRSFPFEAIMQLAQLNPRYEPNNRAKEEHNSGAKALAEALDSNEKEQVLFQKC